jgi:hypothetical protein
MIHSGKTVEIAHEFTLIHTDKKFHILDWVKDDIEDEIIAEINFQT